MSHSAATTRHSSRPRSDAPPFMLEANETLVTQLTSKFYARQSSVTDALHACSVIRVTPRLLETR